MPEIVTLVTIACKLTSLVQHEVNLHLGIGQDVQKIKHELQHISEFLRDARDSSSCATNQHNQVWVNQVKEAAFQAEDIIDMYTIYVEPDQQYGSCSCFNFKARHNLASEIKRIIALFDELSKTNDRYRSFQSGSVGRLSSQRATDFHNGQQDAYFLNESDLVGIDAGKADLINLLLTEDFNHKVISVVGMGGIGKTTLVKKVFDDVEVKS